jgi:transcriptional repressor NrdR
MQCPICQSDDHKVTDSRPRLGEIRRRRECQACGERFTTSERIDSPAWVVIKKDGSEEEYDPSKLQVGLRKACDKRPIPSGWIDKLIFEIETMFERSPDHRLPSHFIGSHVLNSLLQVDFIAYMRFASVFKKLTDVDDFRAEMDAAERTILSHEIHSLQLPLLHDVALVPTKRSRRRRPNRTGKETPEAQPE